MIVVECRLIPKRYCVNLFGMVWSRDTSWIDQRVLRHERIHTAQMREMLYLPFYIFYLLEYLVKLLIYRDHDRAYRSISFEREAYAKESSCHYLSLRHPYDWMNYISD